MTTSIAPETKGSKMQPRMRHASTVARPVAAPSKSERPPEKPVEFTLANSTARSVAVAGSFNNWDPKRNALQKDGAGWKATVWLPPGRYEYRFVVDGQWINDPKARDCAPNPFGGTNCVLTV